MLSVRQHSDAQSFLDCAENWLLQKEVEHNYILSAVYLLLSGSSPFQEPFYFATVERGAEVIGCALRTPPDGLYLSDLPPDAIPRVIGQVAKTYESLPVVTGPEITIGFAEQWKRQEWTVNSRHRWHSLRKVVRPRTVMRGELRKGRESDLPIIDEWASVYAREVGTAADLTVFFRLMLKRGMLHLWDDGGPKCVVTTSGLTRNSARISSLFTAPEFRRSGYATNVVASASQHILESGKPLCVVAADVDSPGPNAVFRSVGYEPGEEYYEIDFV